MKHSVTGPGEQAPVWMDAELGVQYTGYLYPPLCELTSPHETGYDIVANYDPTRYASDPIRLADAVQYVYDYAKSSRPAPPNTPPGIDLTSPYSVNGMMHHVIAHAATGDVRQGVSNTRVIPYWDREAFIVGLARVIPDNPRERQERLEIVDGLCINILRTLAHYYVGRIGANPDVSADEHHENIARIEVALLKGKQSKEDPYTDRLAALSVARRALEGDVDTEALRDMDRMHAVAKLKQLLWLVDQQRDERVRGQLVNEMVELTDAALEAGITEEELALDMGADTGISRATHRPLYDIRSFRQLEHLGADDYWVEQERCHIIPLRNLLESIDRPGGTRPAYESDGRYRLPLRFNGSPRVARQRRAAQGVTDLLVR